MNSKGLLDLILRSGKELANEGKDKLGGVVQNHAGEGGSESFVKGAGTGAALTGLAGLLLGTSTGRSALKLGSIAAIGAVAVRSYQNWSAKNTDASLNPASTTEFGLENTSAAEALLATMIAAAKADGRIDTAEQEKIDQYLGGLGDLDPDLLHFMKQELTAQRDIPSLAAMSKSTEQASQMYLAALVAITVDSLAEMQWLEDFSQALGLSAELKRDLENKATEA